MSESPIVPSNPDHSEFLRIYTQHHRALYHYALMLVVRHADVDDVLQEASVALWKKFGEYDSRLPFLPWARRVVYLEVLNLRQRQKKLPVALTAEVIEQLAADNPAHDDVLEVQRQALGSCVQKLRVKDRDLLDARYRAESSLSSFAKSAGRPVQSIYVTLNRIRKQLMQCVDRALRAEGMV